MQHFYQPLPVLSSDNKYFATAEGTSVVARETATGRVVLNLTMGTPPKALVFHSDRPQLVVTGTSRIVMTFDLSTGRQVLGRDRPARGARFGRRARATADGWQPQAPDW